MRHLNKSQTQHFLVRTATVIVFIVSILTGCKKDAEEAEEECIPVAPTGSLGTSVETFTFTSHGGAMIEINPATGIKITHRDYPGFRIDCWGAVDGKEVISGNHENLNLKHIKDRKATRRSFVFPDGSKITYLTAGHELQLLWVSIYDGKQYHRINMECKTVEASMANTADVAELDAKEADGETAAIEFTGTGLLFVNIYQEDTPGNKIQKREPLGEIYRNQPSRVDDYYDDPTRLDT